MRKLLCWLVVIVIAAMNLDTLEREINLITQVPIPFTIALLLCGIPIYGFMWWLLKTLYSGRIENLKSNIETLQTDKKSLEERLKTKNEELENQQKEYEREIKTGQTSKTEQLTINQLEVLELIKYFEIFNPTQPNQFPPECSVDEVVSKLGLEYGQVNEIFRQLRRAGLVCSVWEGQATFPNLDRPINEEKSVRLTPEGRAYLESHRKPQAD